MHNLVGVPIGIFKNVICIQTQNVTFEPKVPSTDQTKI